MQQKQQYLDGGLVIHVHPLLFDKDQQGTAAGQLTVHSTHYL